MEVTLINPMLLPNDSLQDQQPTARESPASRETVAVLMSQTEAALPQPRLADSTAWRTASTLSAPMPMAVPYLTDGRGKYTSNSNYSARSPIHDESANDISNPLPTYAFNSNFSSLPTNAPLFHPPAPFPPYRPMRAASSISQRQYPLPAVFPAALPSSAPPAVNGVQQLVPQVQPSVPSSTPIDIGQRGLIALQFTSPEAAKAYVDQPPPADCNGIQPADDNWQDAKNECLQLAAQLVDAVRHPHGPAPAHWKDSRRAYYLEHSGRTFEKLREILKMPEQRKMLEARAIVTVSKAISIHEFGVSKAMHGIKVDSALACKTRINRMIDAVKTNVNAKNDLVNGLNTLELACDPDGYLRRKLSNTSGNRLKKDNLTIADEAQRRSMVTSNVPIIYNATQPPSSTFMTPPTIGGFQGVQTTVPTTFEQMMQGYGPLPLQQTNTAKQGPKRRRIDSNSDNQNDLGFGAPSAKRVSRKASEGLSNLRVGDDTTLLQFLPTPQPIASQNMMACSTSFGYNVPQPVPAAFPRDGTLAPDAFAGYSSSDMQSFRSTVDVTDRFAEETPTSTNVAPTPHSAFYTEQDAAFTMGPVAETNNAHDPVLFDWERVQDSSSGYASNYPVNASAWIPAGAQKPEGAGQEVIFTGAPTALGEGLAHGDEDFSAFFDFGPVTPD